MQCSSLIFRRACVQGCTQLELVLKTDWATTSAKVVERTKGAQLGREPWFVTPPFSADESSPFAARGSEFGLANALEIASR